MMNPLGRKTVEVSLRSMKGKFLSLILLASAPHYAAPPRESVAVQEMRLTLDQFGYQINSQKVESTLLHERLQGLEHTLKELHQELAGKNPLSSSFEKRLVTLEKAHETLIGDFKTLKNHMNKTNTALAKCQDKTSQIDKQLSSDVKSLKSSLHSMLALLQKGDSHSYVVQNGDSLSQIAIDHETDVNALKKLNNLQTDIIYSGQELLLP